MHPLELQSRLDGVIAFAPTPFDVDDTVHLAAVARQVDFLARSRVAAVVVAGGVGEFYALDADEHRALVGTAVDASAGRIPVVAGVAHSTRLACAQAESAAAAGADGIMVNPLYFADAESDGLFAHYEAIGSAAALGAIIFHCKPATYDVETLCKLAELDTVVAVKDEVGDLDWFTRARESIGTRLTWVSGMAELLAVPYAAAGATAMTSGIANFAPSLSLAIWEAAREGRYADAEALIADHIRPLAGLRERRKGYATTVIKEAMNLRGLGGGNVRLPLLPLREEERIELARMIETLPDLDAALAAEMPTQR